MFSLGAEKPQRLRSPTNSPQGIVRASSRPTPGVSFTSLCEGQLKLTRRHSAMQADTTKTDTGPLCKHFPRMCMRFSSNVSPPGFVYSGFSQGAASYGASVGTGPITVGSRYRPFAPCSISLRVHVLPAIPTTTICMDRSKALLYNVIDD